MPKLSSAQRTTVASGRKAIRNKSLRSALKTSIATAERLIRAGDDAEMARASTAAASSALDQAANKGIIHPNNAGRSKARLMKKLNALNP